MKSKYLFVILIVGMVLISGCVQGTEISDEVLEEVQPEIEKPEETQPEKVSEEEIPEEIPEETITENIKEFNITAKKFEFIPDTITVSKGDTVKLHVTSIDVTHGFNLLAFKINENILPGKTVDIEFIADRTGSFEILCSVFCGYGHDNMKGKFIVE